MGLLFLLLILLVSILRLFDSGPAGQLASDGLVLAGLFALPVLIRRRRQGAEFLTSGGGGKGSASGEAAGTSHLDERSGALGLSRAFQVWVLAAGLLYGFSLLVSRDTGVTLHACRQVAAGVLLFSILASFRSDTERTLDLMLGLAWVLWLLVFLGPLWGPYVPRLWSILAGPFPTVPVLPAEIDPPVAAWGAVALGSWFAGLVMVSSGLGRKLAALAAHTLLWALWGVLGGPWLPLTAAVPLLLTVACCTSRLRGAWGWFWALAILGGTAWVAAAGWAPWGQRLWSLGALWQPPFGASAIVADYRTALFHFPFGIGALCHEAVRSVFSVDTLARPVPGGQQLLWVADLGLFGPLLSAALAGLIVWSVRYVGHAYREALEPSRDPEALRLVKESEYPVAPAVLPATLLAWVVVTLSFRDFDLYRSPIFWVYLGLWVAWLCSGPSAAESKAWERMRTGAVLVFAVLFLFVAGMRELGRYYYHQALSAQGSAERKIALLAAQYWDRWNPEYEFRLGRLALSEGRGRAEALVDGRRRVERALRLAPSNGEGLMLLSRFERADGHLPEAVAAAKRAVFFSPDRAELRRELGGLCESTGLLERGRTIGSGALGRERR